MVASRSFVVVVARTATGVDRNDPVEDLVAVVVVVGVVGGGSCLR